MKISQGLEDVLQGSGEYVPGFLGGFKVYTLKSDFGYFAKGWTTFLGIEITPLRHLCPALTPHSPGTAGTLQGPMMLGGVPQI